jgi:phage baseplate assembly protein gpV
MMNGMSNVMRREAARVASQTANVRLATVTSYDPSNYAAKVLIQPEGHETGFLPVTSPWAGNGWGLFCPPTPGDVVDVHFQEGGKQAGFVALRHFGDQFRPLPVPSGEFWLVHRSGSFVKLHNDGTIEINAQTAVNATAPVFNLVGDVNVTGNIIATGDISDLSDGSGTMAHIRATFDLHTHGGIEPGGGNTAIPNQLL